MSYLFDINCLIVIPAEAGNQKMENPTFYETIIYDGLAKSRNLVTPAKAGVQKWLKLLDSGSSPE